MTRIILIHAYAPSVEPMAVAFRQLWPEAQTLNLLDETLYADVGPDGTIPDGITDRLRTLFRHARASGAAAALFTGSTFGPAVEAARQGVNIPILKADEALCLEALARGGRSLVLCTAQRAIPVIHANLLSAAEGRPFSADALWVEGAKAALERGDAETHERLIAEALVTAAADYDVLILGQASMAPARALVSPNVAARCLTGPEAAARRLRSLVTTTQ
jgi:Asp/Glu/hydantoin racemase